MENLETAEKSVMEYMVTSPLVNELGFYRLPVPLIMFDLGIDRETAEKAIAGLASKKRIAYDETRSMLAIANFHRMMDHDRPHRMDVKSVCLSFEAFPPTKAVGTTIDWLMKSGMIAEECFDKLMSNEWVAESMGMDSSKSPIEMPKAEKLAKATEEPAISHDSAEPAGLDVLPVTAGQDASEPSENSFPQNSNADDSEDETAATDTASSNEMPADAADDAKADDSQFGQIPELEGEACSQPEEAAGTEIPETDKKEPAKKARSSSKEECVDPVTQKHLDEFDALWLRYPRKQGKRAACEGYLYMVNKGELTFDVAARALDNYLYELKKNGTDSQFVLGGRRFFGKKEKVILDYINTEDSQSDSLQEADKKLWDELAPKFNMFWAVYPKKVGREKAEANFRELAKEGFSPDALISAASAYYSECSAKSTEERYIKRADSFLDLENRPFRDYLDRNDLSIFNVHSGEIEEPEFDNGVEAMDEFFRREGIEVEDSKESSETIEAEEATEESINEEQEEDPASQDIPHKEDAEQENQIEEDSPLDEQEEETAEKEQDEEVSAAVADLDSDEWLSKENEADEWDARRQEMEDMSEQERQKREETDKLIEVLASENGYDPEGDDTYAQDTGYNYQDDKEFVRKLIEEEEKIEDAANNIPEEPATAWEDNVSLMDAESNMEDSFNEGFAVGDDDKSYCLPGEEAFDSLNSVDWAG